MSPKEKDRPKPGFDGGVPTGTFTVFPGCAGLLIGFAGTLLDEPVVP
jgi:hypothetical protein